MTLDGPAHRRCVYLMILGMACGGALQAQESEPPGHGISGRVTESDGTPLVGATVRVRAKKHGLGRRYTLGAGWVSPVEVKTAEDGAFSARLEIEGPYVVFVTHPTHPPFVLAEACDDGAELDLTVPQPIVFRGSVQDTDGKPIAGADVMACGRQATSFGPSACLQTRSAADGSYVLNRIAEGRYRLQAWAPGYAVSAVESGQFPLPENPDDAPGRLVLEPGAEVSGTVVDDTGSPLAGIQVRHATDRVRLRQARGQRDVFPLNLLFTDSKGEFHLRGLPAGEALKLFANVTRNGSAETDTLNFDAGAVVGGITIVYERPATVTVHLIDPDEQPIESLRALWRPFKDAATKPGGIRLAGSAGRTKVRALGQGRFEISEILPGRYDVTLLPSRHREIEVSGLRVPPGAAIDLGTRIARSGNSVSGYVLDDLGDPIDGAQLEGTYLSDGKSMTRTAKSEADGGFVLGGLTDDPLLLLKIEAAGHTARHERRVDTNQDNLEYVLERVGIVRGRVLLENGDPGIRVEASLQPESGSGLSPARRNRTIAKGDEEGRFEITDASPGAHYLRLTARGAKPRKVKNVVVEAGATTDVGTYRLERGLQFSGHVLDARDGSPIVGAAVRAASADGGLGGRAATLGTATTDDDGRFVVEGLEPGRLVATATHVDYAAEKVELVLEEDEPLDEVTMQLGQGGTLRGSVRDESGRPSPGRAIGLIEEGAFTPNDATVRTDESGEYRVERVRPATYRVVLYPDPSGDVMSIRQKSATIRAARETVVDFDNEARITLNGLLTREGRPVGEVTVLLIPSAGAGVLQARTASVDISGRFELGLNQPGGYNVIVQDLQQGAIVGRTRIEVPDEPVVTKEIVLQSGTILGTVLDGSGDPIADAVVSATLQGARAGEIGSSTTARVGADGSYRIEGANDGIYTVTAIADGYSIATENVNVADSATVDGVDFRLEPSRELHGQVVDELGRGVPGALVFASIVDTPAASGIPSEADADGFFHVTAPGEGACDLEAVARGFAPGRLAGFVPSPDPQAPGARITLTRGATILLHIVDAAGAGVEGVQPIVQPERPSQLLTIARLLSPISPSDSAGTSRVRGLAAGSYRIAIAGYPAFEGRTVTLTGDGETELTLELP